MAIHLYDTDERIAAALGVDTKDVTHITPIGEEDGGIG